MFDVKGIGEKRDLPEATCFLSTVTPNIVEEEGMASGPLEGHPPCSRTSAELSFLSLLIGLI